MAKFQRGLNSEQEQDSSRLIRDTRSLGKRCADFFRRPASVATLIVVMSVGNLLFPATTDILGLTSIIFFIIVMISKTTLPFRMPMRAHTMDYNDIKPGSTKPNESRGIYHFGNDRKTNEELWFNNDDMRTHVLIFGSTGSGKTEALIGIAYNSIVQGSGFIYVDGKGDNSLFAKIFSMVRSMGREDDMLLINFMTGAKDVQGPQEKRISNTLNPFASGSSSMLSNLIVSMMDSSSGGGDGDMWKGRAIAFVEGLMKVLVSMRDAGHLLLDANSIRNYFSLDRIEAMVMDKVFIRDGQYAISLEPYPDVILEPMKNYLLNLPGYNKDRKGKQVSQVFEQHGFITMQLIRVFTSLADTYGHILRTKLAEVDLKDVVLNRRILVVLLPALEKSPDELANLGKVVIASLRTMMAAGLGDEVEGRFHDLVTKKPTNARTPYLCILDEYGYYAVKGFAVVPAQARSLGFSVVFAGQDLPAFEKASKEEAASIGANTNIKICMKLEDPQGTWEFFSKTAGESYVTHVESYQSSGSSLSNTYMDTKGAKVEKRARIDLLDLKEQREGEGHIFFKSKIVRYQTFYADPKPVKEMRLNQFMKVDLPQDGDLYKLVKGIEDFEVLCQQNLTFQFASDDNATLSTVVNMLAEQPQEQSAVERGLNMLLAYREQTAASVDPAAEAVEVPEGTLNIFSMGTLSDDLKAILDDDEQRVIAEPVLLKSQVSSQVSYLLRMLGASEASAQQISGDMVTDMQMSTDYGPPQSVKPEPEMVAAQINELVEFIRERKQSGSDEESTDSGATASGSDAGSAGGSGAGAPSLTPTEDARMPDTDAAAGDGQQDQSDDSK